MFYSAIIPVFSSSELQVLGTQFDCYGTQLILRLLRLLSFPTWFIVVNGAEAYSDPFVGFTHSSPAFFHFILQATYLLFEYLFLRYIFALRRSTSLYSLFRLPEELYVTATILYFSILVSFRILCLKLRFITEQTWPNVLILFSQCLLYS